MKNFDSFKMDTIELAQLFLDFNSKSYEITKTIEIAKSNENPRLEFEIDIKELENRLSNLIDRTLTEAYKRIKTMKVLRDSGDFYR